MIESNKLYLSLIIEVVNEEMANRLINGEIIEFYGKHDCEYFEKGYKMLQYFNCFKFGYIARFCKNKPFYYKYGDIYTPDKYKSQPKRIYCASCKDSNYKLWITVYPR